MELWFPIQINNHFTESVSLGTRVKRQLFQWILLLAIIYTGGSDIFFFSCILNQNITIAFYNIRWGILFNQLIFILQTVPNSTLILYLYCSSWHHLNIKLKSIPIIGNASSASSGKPAIFFFPLVYHSLATYWEEICKYLVPLLSSKNISVWSQCSHPNKKKMRHN